MVFRVSYSTILLVGNNVVQGAWSIIGFPMSGCSSRLSRAEKQLVADIDGCRTFDIGNIHCIELQLGGGVGGKVPLCFSFRHVAQSIILFCFLTGHGGFI